MIVIHNQFMKKFALAFVVICVGCGGSGGGSSSPTGPSPFAGNYNGQFNAPGFDDGSMQLSIASNGTITGLVFSNALSESGTLAGRVATDGVSSINATFPSYGTGNIHSTVTLTNNVFNGTGTESWKGSNHAITYSLQAQ